MVTEYERVMKFFMPALRSRAANIMVKEYGIRQQRAAELLGTTQAAISKYIGAEKRYNDIKIDPDLIRKFVENVKEDNLENGQKLMCKMCQINKKFDCALMAR